MNRFNWIGKQQEDEGADTVYLLCKNELPNKLRCSSIYKKGTYEDDTCPICGSYAAVDIYKDQKLDHGLNEHGLHKLFFNRVPKVFEEMDVSIWQSLGNTAWKNSNEKEQIFLSFCMAFQEVSGDPTQTESDYWDIALAAEASIRSYLVKKQIQIVKQHDFNLSHLADGMLVGKEIRTLQAHYGISLCGTVFSTHTQDENERKYQKAIRIAERLAVIGCSASDNLPYFKAADHLSS
jgi:hypothetical protein